MINSIVTLKVNNKLRTNQLVCFKTSNLSIYIYIGTSKDCNDYVKVLRCNSRNLVRQFITSNDKECNENM